MAEPILNRPGALEFFATDRPDELLAQLTPETTDDPRVRAFVEEMLKTEEGRERLERHRDLWEKRGIPVPWERPSDTANMHTPATEELDDGDGSLNR